MIDKILHYCWFGGGKLTELELECMDSWKNMLSEYQVIRWDETSFPINSHPYVKAAYEAKKYAFVSDYVRIWALYNYGGIYLDTDYKILKTLDTYLSDKLFMGNENDEFIGTAIIGSEKGHWLLEQWLKYYDTHPFMLTPDTYNMIPNTMIITDIMMQYGYKRGIPYNLNDIHIYGRDVFFPSEVDKSLTYGIHYFRGSWWSEKEKKRANNKFYRIFIRPILLFIKRILKYILGEEKIYKLEIIIKKILK